MISNQIQLDRVHLRIADLERCIRETQKNNESSTLSVLEHARVLVMLERALRALHVRVDASYSSLES